jgi:hypothetical protein
LKKQAHAARPGQDTLTFTGESVYLPDIFTMIAGESGEENR